jgi:hypothetical protein
MFLLSLIMLLWSYILNLACIFLSFYVILVYLSEVVDPMREQHSPRWEETTYSPRWGLNPPPSSFVEVQSIHTRYEIKGDQWFWKLKVNFNMPPQHKTWLHHILDTTLYLC